MYWKRIEDPKLLEGSQPLTIQTTTIEIPSPISEFNENREAYDLWNSSLCRIRLSLSNCYYLDQEESVSSKLLRNAGHEVESAPFVSIRANSSYDNGQDIWLEWLATTA
jgi:hypothetical protein